MFFGTEMHALIYDSEHSNNDIDDGHNNDNGTRTDSLVARVSALRC